jgi:hypothetical protein
MTKGIMMIMLLLFAGALVSAGPKEDYEEQIERIDQFTWEFKDGPLKTISDSLLDPTRVIQWIGSMQKILLILQ